MRRRNPTITSEFLHIAAGKRNYSSTKYMNDGRSYGKDADIGMKPDPTNPDVFVPISSITTKTTMSLANNTENRIIHKTTFRSGKRPTGSLLALAKSEGTVYKKCHDSKIEFRLPADRNTLTWGAGFNSKTYCMLPEYSLFTWNDLMNFIHTADSDIGTGGQAKNPNKKIKTLASVLSTSSQFMFYNQSNVLPALMKIHVVKLKESEALQDPGTTPANVGKAYMLLAGARGENTGQKFDGVPAYYAHNPFALEIGSDAALRRTTRAEFPVSLKLQSLMVSDFFREQCDVVKTFSQRLEPGDFWNFRHIHSYGPGIDLAMANMKGNENTGQDDTDIRQTTGDLPVTYAFIVETYGYMCEGIMRTDTNNYDQYLGTSPTFITQEFKTAIHYVLDSTDQEPGTSIDGPPKCHRRIWISDPSGLTESTIGGALPTTADKEIFVLNASIVESRASADSAGKMYIPTSTSESVQTVTRLGNANS
jgi:hypothetical protein